jgi:hypothetical protein
VALIDESVLKALAPALQPTSAEQGTQPALTGTLPRFSGGGPIPLGIIVILGVPPVISPAPVSPAEI